MVGLQSVSAPVRELAQEEPGEWDLHQQMFVQSLTQRKQNMTSEEKNREQCVLKHTHCLSYPPLCYSSVRFQHLTFELGLSSKSRKGG